MFEYRFVSIACEIFIVTDPVIERKKRDKVFTDDVNIESNASGALKSCKPLLLIRAVRRG